MKIKITADSTCDLSPALLQENEISLIPLTVVMNDRPYLDGVTIRTEDIFAHVASGGALCSTSAVSVGEYEDFFTKHREGCDALIHITIGSGFSSCYQNACIAAEDVPGVFVVDSQNLSTGQGHIVMEACALARQGLAPAEICRELQELTKKVEASFLLDRLDYMVKGGRCSAVAAFGANLLNLKPCIEVKDGKMQVVKKYRGSYPKCLASYVKDRLANRNDLRRERLFITHTPVTAECYQAVTDAVAACERFQSVEETTAGCTISCHCGPGTLGVLFIRK